MTAPETKLMLKPCPFCGGDDLALDENNYKTKWIVCDGCGATIHDSPHGDCDDLWNTRATEPARSPPGSAGASLREAIANMRQRLSGDTVQVGVLLRELDNLEAALAQSSIEGRREEIAREAAIEECMKVIDDLRSSEAGLFDAKHSGQRGCDRADALYDACQKLRALAHPRPVLPVSENEGESQ